MKREIRFHFGVCCKTIEICLYERQVVLVFLGFSFYIYSLCATPVPHFLTYISSHVAESLEAMLRWCLMVPVCTTPLDVRTTNPWIKFHTEDD